jgi:hypothetical protein
MSEIKRGGRRKDWAPDTSGPLNLPQGRPEYANSGPHYGALPGSVGGSANWPTPHHLTPGRLAPTRVHRPARRHVAR